MSSGGYETCPSCNKPHLPVIREGSMATGRRCQKCGAVVDRAGQIESPPQLLPAPDAAPLGGTQ